MSVADFNWAGFYLALCLHGPSLLTGLDETDRDLVAALSADTDAFWSDALPDLVGAGAAVGDLRGGVLAAIEQWRENVLTELSSSFSLQLDWDAVTVDLSSPLINDLVEAADPATAVSRE